MAENSLDLDTIVCSADIAVVAFLAPGCPLCEKYLPVLHAVAAERPGTVFVEAWLDRVPEFAARIGAGYAPLTVLFSRCRALAGLPGVLEPEDLRLLLDRVAPELLEGETRKERRPPLPGPREG